MKGITLFTFALILITSDIILSKPLARQAQPDRTVFSRYANSRFPFFTIDMTRLQDRIPQTGRKRAIENDHDGMGDGRFEEQNEMVPLLDQLAPDDIADTFGTFDNEQIGNFKAISAEFSRLEDAPIEQQQEAIEKRNDFRKRIHTCAFMRRMGVPIGLCFSNLRKINEESKNKIRAQSTVSQRDPYQYLERQWQGHTMLGGGVGRR